MVDYMIIPLGMTDEEEQIYKMLYKKADFESMETKYTTSQLVADSNPIFNLTVKKVGRILKNLIDIGYLIVIKTGSKGNPTIYKIVKLIDINEDIEEGKLKENQREIKRKLKGNPIKEKEKENEKEDIIKTPILDLVINKLKIEMVRITTEQYKSLVTDYGINTINNQILSLDNYLLNGKGKEYKDHNRVLRTWIAKDKNNKPSSHKEIETIKSPQYNILT